MIKKIELTKFEMEQLRRIIEKKLLEMSVICDQINIGGKINGNRTRIS